MIHTALDVAKWILNYNQWQVDNSGADLISNLKLQKLLYYAQGCYLALYDEKLFKDDIVAWQHGPVVEVVYHEYKINRDRGIEEFGNFKEDYSDEQVGLLKTVYETFGQYSAWGLRNMTHSEAPWKETKQGEVINTDLIKEFFQKEYIENA